MTYDLVVVGGGSGGVRAARRAAELGARVALCEPGRMGGTCVHRGCVPKKLMALAAAFPRERAAMAAFGWDTPEPRFHWNRFRETRDRELARLEGAYRARLERAGVTVVNERARFRDARTVEAGGRLLSFRHAVVAVGGRPFLPPVPGRELGVTSDELFHLEALPRRLVVVGGGYIATEFASIFRGLGSEVTVLHRSPEILPAFDRRSAAFLREQLAARGIRFEGNEEVVAVETAPEGRRVRTRSGALHSGDVVLFATGRRPATEGLGLEALGLVLGPNGALAVDGLYRTAVPHLFAVGDCTDRVKLTPVAIAEGDAVAYQLFGKAGPLESGPVPTAVFTDPPFATVGLSEERARELCDGAEVRETAFRPLKLTLSPASEERTLIRIVVDKTSRRIVGAHMVGEDAPEIIQLAAVALAARSTEAHWKSTLSLHPTAAEELVRLADGQD